jgi:hypothetical protein
MSARDDELAATCRALRAAVGELRDAIEILTGALELDGEDLYVRADLDDVSVTLREVDAHLRRLVDRTGQ